MNYSQTIPYIYTIVSINVKYTVYDGNVFNEKYEISFFNVCDIHVQIIWNKLNIKEYSSKK